MTALSVADVFTQDGPFRVPDLARVLRCSTTYLYTCIHEGAVRAGKVGDHYRVPAEEARRLATAAGLSPPTQQTQQTQQK